MARRLCCHIKEATNIWSEEGRLRIELGNKLEENSWQSSQRYCTVLRWCLVAKFWTISALNGSFVSLLSSLAFQFENIELMRRYRGFDDKNLMPLSSINFECMEDQLWSTVRRFWDLNFVRRCESLTVYTLSIETVRQLENFHHRISHRAS